MQELQISEECRGAGQTRGGEGHTCPGPILIHSVPNQPSSNHHERIEIDFRINETPESERRSSKSAKRAAVRDKRGGKKDTPAPDAEVIKANVLVVHSQQGVEVRPRRRNPTVETEIRNLKPRLET